VARHQSSRVKLVVPEKDRRKTLQDLDGQDWGEPTFPSHVVTECHRLHKTQLSDFRVEDLRLMIGQQFCLPYLLPLAIEHLQRAPLVQGDFYPGDLYG
jgi:contact-dependent growth inhibition (CDI) system CdiI-like immunity protein